MDGPPDKLAGRRYHAAMPVCITRSAICAMLAAARAQHPREACGLLLGCEATVMHAAITANIADEPHRRFAIDPAALIAAHRAQRQGGPALLGYFHSHPGGAARPSPVDSAMAAGDGRIWAIVAAPTITLWRDCPAGFEALSYKVVAG